MLRIGALAATLLLAGPALAAGETPFEKTSGWEIERTANGSSCLMSKSYKDTNDNNAENGLVLALVADKVVISFVYEHWEWDKNQKLQVPLVLDKTVAIQRSLWTGDGQSLTAELPDSLIPKMLAAKMMVLKLDGADADFNLAGFPQAYESLRRCENTPKGAAATPAPAAPPAPTETTASAHIVKAMTFPGDGDVPPRSSFATDTPKIVLGIQVRGLQASDKLTATWVAEKTEAAPPNFEIASVAVPLGASELVSSSLSKPNAGWPAGRYRVDLRVNDGPVEFRQYFDIEGSK